jgi:hypothetical protein
VTTDACPDRTDTATGYRVALRWNGELVVSSQPADRSGMVERGSTPTSPIVTPVLAAGPDSGPVTELSVHPLTGALRAGHRLVLPGGQVAVLSADASAGAASLAVEALIPAGPLRAGTLLPQEVVLAVDKTPTGLTVHRVDDRVSAPYTDATWSGGYLFLRNSRDDVAAISCSSLTISEPGGDPCPATS